LVSRVARAIEFKRTLPSMSQFCNVQHAILSEFDQRLCD
jgi:hypothetical protein